METYPVYFHPNLFFIPGVVKITRNGVHKIFPAIILLYLISG